MEEQKQSQRKRVRDDSTEFNPDSLEVKRIRENLLGLLENSDDRDPLSQDLDSVMRSFEEELSGSNSFVPSTKMSVAEAPEQKVSFVDLTSPRGGGVAQTPADFSFLLGTLDDDDFGLPSTATTTTTTSSLVMAGKDIDDDVGLGKENNDVVDHEHHQNSELIRVSSDSSEVSDFWPFQDDDIPSYDLFGFGQFGVAACGGGSDNNGGNFISENGAKEYVDLDGIFDYSDVNFGLSDQSDVLWRPNSLPAL